MEHEPIYCPYCGQEMTLLWNRDFGWAKYECCNPQCESGAPSASTPEEACQKAKSLYRPMQGQATPEKEQQDAADWEEAERYLNMMIAEYAALGGRGAFGLQVGLLPLKKRFDDGERTRKLYDEIMEVH